MTPPVWLYGRIGEGRRRRILQMTLKAEPVSALPDESGVLCVTGEDFVQAEIRKPSLSWMQTSGRLLLVVPPLQPGPQELPVHWTVQYADTPPQGGDDLAVLVAGEVQYRLHGDLLTDRIRDLQFAGSALAVGYYRPRISTGVVAITVLPIWSLRVVDRPELLQGWIARLFELAGKPVAATGAPQAAPALTPLHYSILLHLSSRRYETMDNALEALASSPVFRIARDPARVLAEDLVRLGYIEQTQLTDMGHEVLARSPYAVYLDALKAGNA